VPFLQLRKLLHDAHHRGQIATYVSANGKPPINSVFYLVLFAA